MKELKKRIGLSNQNIEGGGLPSTTFGQTKSGTGFSLIEVAVTLAVFAMLATAVLGVVAALNQAVKTARQSTLVSSLADNYMEIVHNMPYSQIGTVHGNPVGTLPDCNGTPPTCPGALLAAIGGQNYKIYYEVTYIDDPADGVAPADPAPADYKQVKLSVQNAQTNGVTNFVTTVVPKGLENTNNAGALSIGVINYLGQSVPGATITIQSPPTNPVMNLSRLTDANGKWTEVGLPAGANNYRVTATKSGYSTDQTYPITGQNPNPTNPDATVLNGHVTSLTFGIDALANLTVNTVDQYCGPKSGVGINISGAKIIGTNPSVYKFNQNFTSSAGAVVLNNLEWDTYTPVLLTGQGYVIAGTSPVQKIDVLPGTAQTFTMVLNSVTTGNTLLVIVKDAATQTAQEGAAVTLTNGVQTYGPYYTGGSVWIQTDWSGGPGQALFDGGGSAKYWTDDGNINNNNPTGQIQLRKTGSSYAPSGFVESSTYDTGTASSQYTTLTWQPLAQSPNTTLRFQLAANNDNATWNYVGPDGATSTYYTVSGTNISSALNNNRYVRYKTYLSTTNSSSTPVLTSLNINYVSGCRTPGQVLFNDSMSSGGNYKLTVTMPGYSTSTVSNMTVSGDQIIQVLVSP